MRSRLFHRSTTKAATFCVDSSDALTAALATAEANGEDNDIRLRAGAYEVPDAGFHIDLLEGHHSLSVTGGFTDDACTERTHAASATVLDGRDAVRPLTIETSRSSGIADPAHGITVGGLTFQHGSDALVSALKISDSGPIYGGIITVEGNAFLDNGAATGVLEGGPALLAATDGPDFAGGTGLFVRNNLFARNAGPNAPAVFVYSNNHIDVSNNTFVDNVVDRHDARRARDVRIVHVQRHRFQQQRVQRQQSGRRVRDVRPARHQRHRSRRQRDRRDVRTRRAAKPGRSTADPRFVDAAHGDYRLAADSPLIDAGTDTPAGGIAEFDLDGVARIEGAHIDIGAYERTPVNAEQIFADGFDGA